MSECRSQVSTEVKKYPIKRTYKEERHIFGSWFQSMAIWPCCFGSTVRQNIIEEVCDRQKLLTSWWAGRREREIELETDR
jgi:hypothetical protein